MYCTEQDVRDLLKPDLQAQLLQGEQVATPEAAQQRLTQLILQAIDDAGAEIDGYLSKRYPVPLTPAPVAIAKNAKDIAAYNLVSRVGVGKENDRESIYRERYRNAIRFLEMIAKGTVELGISSPAKQAAHGFRMDNSERLFSRKSMKGM